MNNKLLLLCIIIVIILINKYTDIDTFLTLKSQAISFEDDGKMTFDFLKDDNTKNVLDTYYINDDKKLNGQKVNLHPYQYKVQQIIPVKDSPPFLYGNNRWHYQRSEGKWNKYDTYAQDIYNKYGVRR